jgi:outer membrane lipoprotein SlyB
MSTKFMIAAALAVTMSGCATFAPVTGNHYTSPDGKLDIQGQLVDSSDVRIFVNGDNVIEDHVSLVHGDGKFDGTWQGKRVSADCTTVEGRKLGGTTCLVAVGSERVTLTL